jgi:hypothetical protein
MTTTVAAFNNLLKLFIEELARVFPEQRDVATFLAGFDAFVMLAPTQPLDTFLEALSPHASLLMAKDAALFESIRFPGLDFHGMWTSEGVTDGTRDAIWQYLHTLYLLGTTVKSMPPEVLQSIESVAASCADKVDADGEIDFGAVMSALMTSMGPLAAGLGGGGMGLGGGPGAGRLTGGGGSGGGRPKSGRPKRG